MRVIIVDDDKVRSASIKNWLVAVGITSSDFVTIVSCTNMARTSIKNFSTIF